MGKKKKLGLTEYDMVNAVLSDTLFSDRIGKENFVDRTQLTSSYDEYLMDIPKMAQDNTFASGIFYDNDGRERSIKELDDSGFNLDFWNSGGVNNSGKLLSLSKDVMLADGTLLSEQRKREIMSSGVDEQTATEVAQMEAEAEAKRRSSLSENIAGAFGILGGSARSAAGSELVKDKLIPFFHPEKQQWVLKVANDEELKTHGATINTYGASEVSDGIYNSFLKGIHNATARTMSTLLNSGEAFTDFSEAFGNWASGNNWESFDEGTTDKWAERYRKGSEEAQLPTSLQSQDILSAEGLASGVGQGAVSLAQFAMLGGGASTLFRGLGSTLTWGNMGANLLSNMNRAGMFTAGMILNGGEAYDSAKKAGLDEEDAANMFLAVGAINSLVELGLGANKLQKWLIGDKGAEQVPKIILEETGGDLSKLASKKANILSRVTDKVNKFTEIPVLGTAVEEASEEFIQTLVGKTGEFMYNNISDADKTKYELPELQEVFKEAFGAAAVGAILGAVGGIGTINTKKEEENKTILPHIVNGNASIVRSSIRQLTEEGLISPEKAEAYTARIDRLDELWNKNKDVFNKIAKLEGKDENAIKAYTLSLIESEFDLKNKISEHSKKIAEIGSDSELSDAVKQQKINDVKNEILNVQKSLSNITEQIESFIPDSNGNIKYFGLKDSYDNMKSFISKTANRILPLSEEEIEIWFNSTNASEDLNKLVNRVNEEGLTPEIKNEIKTIMGLDDKSQFIANVESIRKGITEAKEKAKQELKESKEKALKEEEEKRKSSREKTKNKKEKISKTSEKTEDKKEDVAEEEDPFDFKQAGFDAEGSNIKDTTEEAEEAKEVKITVDGEVSEKDALLRRHAELQELKSSTENPEEFAFFENEQYEIELRILEMDKEAKKAEKESEGELDDDEKIVIKDIEKQEEQQEKIITSSDGFVKETSTNPQENIIRAEGVKRNTANTVTSLNINYTTTVKDGKRKRVDKVKADGSLDINSNFDSRLQDPTQFKVGTTLQVIIPTYQQIKDRGIEGTYTENQYNNDLKSPDTLPIAFLDESGNIIGYLPTKMNVETNVNEEFLDTERIANAELRGRIFNNQDSDISMTITEKSKGVPMFRNNKITLYRALGDGKSLAPDVHIAVQKDGKLQTSLNNTFPGKIHIPNDLSPETYFEEGVVYAIVPTADGSNYYALPLTANRVAEASSNVIVKMIELFRANSKIAGDKALLDERNSLLTIADFENHKEFMEAVQEIIYVNNDSDTHKFETSKKGITIGSETISWDDFKTTEGKNRVKELLSSRYAAIKLAKMGNPYSAYELKDGKLVTKEYSSYNDYLNDNKILTSNIQSEPIAGTNRRYFTAQSVIEVGNVKIEPKQPTATTTDQTIDNVAKVVETVNKAVDSVEESSLDEAIAELEELRKILAEELSTADEAIDSALTQVTETEIEEVAEELGVSKEEAVEQVKEAVKADFAENGIKETPNKTKLQKLVSKLKKVILSILILSSGYTGFASINISPEGDTSFISIENVSNNTLNIVNSLIVDNLPAAYQGYVHRGLNKLGLVEIKEEVQSVKVIENKGDDLEYHYNYASVKDNTKGTSDADSLQVFERQSLNDKGIRYIPGATKANSESNTQYNNVQGIAHFMITDGDDLTSRTSNQDLNKAKARILKQYAEQNPNGYVPTFKKISDGSVEMKFKTLKEVSKEDIVITRLYQFNFGHLDFSKSKKSAEGVGGKMSVMDTVRNKSVDQLQYTNLEAYGRLSGGSAFFLFKVDGKLIVKEASGSVKFLKDVGEGIAKQYNIDKSEITIGFFDAGSYAAKPKANNGVIAYRQYEGYNNHSNSGASLMIPSDSESTAESIENLKQFDDLINGNISSKTIEAIQRINDENSKKSAEGLVQALSMLLVSIRRKKANGEKITDKDIEEIKARIKELEAFIEANKPLEKPKQSNQSSGEVSTNTTEQKDNKSQNINTGRNNPYTDRYIVDNEMLDKETGALILDFESNAEAIEYFINTYVNSSPSETTSTTEESVVTTKPVEALKKPKNKLGIKVKSNRNKPKVDNDFGEVVNSNLSLDEQAELLMKKCSK